MSTYNYSLITDFTTGGKIDFIAIQILVNSNETIGSTIIGLKDGGDVISFTFANPLTTPQKAELDNVISSYVYIPPPETSRSVIYDCYVSNDTIFPGDHTSIAEAFATGHKSIFVKNGTYYETSNIIIPNGGQLVGEAPGYVIIILLAGSKIVCDSVSGNSFETTGTISISNNSNQVVGVGTTFTNLTPGQFILIGSNYFPIASVTDATHLTLVDTYHGQQVVDKPIKAHPVYSGVRFENFILYGSTNEPLYIRGIRNSAISSIAIYNCGKGLILKDSADLSIVSLVINHCGGDGFLIENCYSLSLNIVNNYNNVGNGFAIKGDSFNINIQTCTSESNGGHGFYFYDTCNLINLTDVVVKYNVGDGVNMNTGVNFLSVSSMDCSLNGGIGVHIQGKNIFVGNGFIINNEGDGLKLTSTSFCCSVEGNTIGTNKGYGCNISGESCSVLGNHLGCNVLGGMLVNSLLTGTISQNVLKNNLLKGILIQPTTSQLIIEANVIKESATKSIELETGVSKCIVSLNIVDIAIEDSSNGGINVNNLLL